MARTCIFCGGSPVTNEHAWPDWLLEFVRNANPDTERTVYARVDGRMVRHWTTEKPEQKVKVVCGSCNHGWMSRLEDAAKPLLVPMFKGEQVSFDLKQQLILATWAVKTGMVFEFTPSPEDPGTLALYRWPQAG